MATGILNIANNIYGIVLVILCGKLMEYYGDIAVHICLCSSLLFGFILTVLTKDEQRRQDAKKLMYISVPRIDITDDKKEMSSHTDPNFAGLPRGLAPIREIKPSEKETFLG
ncbi:hypothetical protein PV326_007009 [Microctonus aethiopoides]|nr:hypothetical protein PV326_007009 [Microctonus aethiopoides]